MVVKIRVKFEFFLDAKILLSKTSKLECVVRMAVDSILPHAEFGPNDHREDAPPVKQATSVHCEALQFSLKSLCVKHTSSVQNLFPSNEHLLRRFPLSVSKMTKYYLRHGNYKLKNNYLNCDNMNVTIRRYDCFNVDWPR